MRFYSMLPSPSCRQPLLCAHKLLMRIVGLQEQLAAGHPRLELDAGQEGAAELAVQRVAVIGRLQATAAG